MQNNNMMQEEKPQTKDVKLTHDEKMMQAESFHVTPITYKLDLDDEKVKEMQPSFKVSSGSFSKIINKKGDGSAKIKRKERANVHVELWDTKRNMLIGTGQLDYHGLASREGKYNQWIPLKDYAGKQIGQALVEVEIQPMISSFFETDKMMDDMFKDVRSIMSDFDKMEKELGLPWFGGHLMLHDGSHHHHGITHKPECTCQCEKENSSTTKDTMQPESTTKK